MPYPAFGKIPRLHRPIVITEKIDGTNGQISIQKIDTPVGENITFTERVLNLVSHEGDHYAVYAGSRNRWLTIQQDNFGFAQWVYQNSATLCETLGEGQHYGEWWGTGIQRNYGLREKRFSLFNNHRWGHLNGTQVDGLYVVPVVMHTTGDLLNAGVTESLRQLRELGSMAAPGFMNPEGVVIYHEGARSTFKATLEGDQSLNGGKTRTEFDFPPVAG